jgi:transcriptional regulator with XRE-family HTH domain
MSRNIATEKYPYSDIGERIRRIRGSLTQQAFADILNVKHPQYNRYEKGRVKPSHNVLEKIAGYGNVSIDWILFGSERGAIGDERILLSKELGIPESQAHISDDEMAIIKSLRALSRGDAISVLNLIIKKLKAGSEISKSYTEPIVEKLKEMVNAGEIKTGGDIQDILWQEISSGRRSSFTVKEIKALLDKTGKKT